MQGGTIYGSDASPESLKNTASYNGASLCVSTNGTAKYGNGVNILPSGTSHGNDTLIGQASDEYWLIIWHLNGGSWPTSYTPPSLAAKGGTLSEPGTPTRSYYYNFGGWYKDAAFTNKVAFTWDLSDVTADIELYAKWESAPIPTLSFNVKSSTYYTNAYGNWDYTEIAFDLIVTDAAGLTSIAIEETISGSYPPVDYRSQTKTRVIAISGPGTYSFTQRIRENGIYNNLYSGFLYTVKAYGISDSINYRGSCTSDGSWAHSFVY